ncbi:MAG: hypothetical protein R3B99_27415 [Polyangiales bacterium]|nr:hypothetical protein [Myxococcales bacterium]
MTKLPEKPELPKAFEHSTTHRVVVRRNQYALTLELENQEESIKDGAASWVYAVVLDEPFPRAKGESRIAYIGHGSTERVRSLTKHHSCHHALVRLLAALEQSEVKASILTVKCDDKTDALLQEAAALSWVCERHGEMPPCNLRWEGYPLGRYLQLLAETLAGSEAKARVYDWPLQELVATWADVYVGRTWKWSLAWVWPDSAHHPEHLLVISPEGTTELQEKFDAVEKAALVGSPVEAKGLGNLVSGGVPPHAKAWLEKAKQMEPGKIAGWLATTLPQTR